jgi:hypothetical protein
MLFSSAMLPDGGFFLRRNNTPANQAAWLFE